MVEKIRVLINPEFKDLIPKFLENRNKEVSTLQESLQSENFPAIESIGHSLKGVCGGYGFDGLSKIGKAIETAAKAKDPIRIKQQIHEMSTYLENLELIDESKADF